MTEALRLDAVSFRYPRDGLGVGPVSLALPAGEALLLAEASGGGKSTLARLACGLIPHLYHGELRGEALLFGQPISRQPLWAISERAGLVFQNPAMQMLTTSVEDEIIFGLENLGLSPAEVRRRLEAALQCLGLEPLRQRGPQTLSGGEQQKLALACALARRPDLLVLDEPLSMLDSTAARDLVGHLRELQAAGQTLLICEHRREFLADLPGLRTARLANGGAARPTAPAPDPGSAAGPLAAAEAFSLTVQSLTARRGGRAILRDLEFTLAAGQLVAVLGRNGTGKTTLLRALAGLQPAEGRLAVQSAAGETAPRFSLVFQNPDLQLFQASVRAEILFRLPQPDLAWYEWLLNHLGLKRYEEAPPLLLSEGEKRRVALATALMRQAPHGVLLDEPSLGQDAHHKAVLLRTLRQLTHAGRLVIMATHDLELAAQADMLLVLGANGLVAHGRPAELMAEAALWPRAGLWLPDWAWPAAETRPC